MPTIRNITPAELNIILQALYDAADGWEHSSEMMDDDEAIALNDLANAARILAADMVGVQITAIK